MKYEDVPAAHARVFGNVVAGHGVASGRANDPRFPDGTLALQWPLFEAAGVKLDGLHKATINIAMAPYRLEIRAPWWRLEDVKWHPDVPAETFSLVPIEVRVGTAKRVKALLYQPDPATKPDHHQPEDVVEVLAPKVRGTHEGAVVQLDVPLAQVTVHTP